MSEVECRVAGCRHIGLLINVMCNIPDWRRAAVLPKTAGGSINSVENSTLKETLHKRFKFENHIWDYKRKRVDKVGQLSASIRIVNIFVLSLKLILSLEKFLFNTIYWIGLRLRQAVQPTL